MRAGPTVIGDDDLSLGQWGNGLGLASPPHSGQKAVS
jgi:hypothetical protein